MHARCTNTSGDLGTSRHSCSAWTLDITLRWVHIVINMMTIFVFLQLGWADTYMVGCGYTYYDDPKRGYSKLYVCNYGPGGNLVGGSMYKMGFPGMRSCQDFDLVQSSRYLGLCGENYFITLEL